MPPKKAAAKKAAPKKSQAKRAPDKDADTSPARKASKSEEVASPSPSRARTPVSSAATPSPARALVAKPSPARLRVQFRPQGSGKSGPSVLEQGLVRLRRSSQLCDVSIVSGFGKIPAHRAVLGAHSEVLAQRLQDMQPPQAELDFQQASHEAVDYVVRFCYGEVTQESFQPSTSKVNEEILKIASECGLPPLAELCAARLAAEASTANVVTSVRLCEEFGLPKLRAALVKGLVEDPAALNAVAKDPGTLQHPALMRELLASIASQD
mmetsp:Transcript_28858/g.54096  ORF Transcript_28858/g.54096 Transcript_28858/m.54096 type:complete len:267 (+) Transcript_28858:52-852(+)